MVREVAMLLIRVFVTQIGEVLIVPFPSVLELYKIPHWCVVDMVHAQLQIIVVAVRDFLEINVKIL